LTVGQAAEVLGTTERFPRRLIAERRIRFVRLGRLVRIPESALREFIAPVWSIPSRWTAREGPRDGASSAIRQSQGTALGPLPGSLSGAGRGRQAGAAHLPGQDFGGPLADAEEAVIGLGDWLNPDAGRVSFKDYAEAWVKERPGLRLKTIERYECVVRLHLVPFLGGFGVAEIKEPHVRRWRKKLVDGGAGEATIAKAYRLLKAIMNTAVGDGRVKRNPCQIKGGGAENAPERPILSIAEVYALADTIEPRFRALVLLTVFADLRWGEAVALRRKDLDLDARLVRIERTLVEVAGSPLDFGPPKTDAGTRRLPVPEVIVDELRAHLEQYAQAGEEGLIFVGAKGAMLRHGGFRRIWGRALAEVGLKGFRFHDLRHTGSTLAAIASATLPELKERMGSRSDDLPARHSGASPGDRRRPQRHDPSTAQGHGGKANGHAAGTQGKKAALT
jgi:excisionase family DNA binding protein